MRLHKKLPLLLCALSLSACVTPTKVITPLDEMNRGVMNIQSVNVKYSDITLDKLISSDEKAKTTGLEVGKSEEAQYQPLKVTLKDIAKERLESRDSNGDLLANIDIEVDSMKLANPLATVLVGDTDQLSGTVRAYDPKTNEVFTEFYVDVLEGSGGLLGLAIRGGGVRERLSLQFADHIGNELGFTEIKKHTKK